MKKLFTRKVRIYIYGVAIAVLGLVSLLGLVPPATATAILPIVLALLNLKDDDVAGAEVAAD